jgi:cobalt/nickel transport system permease protein
MHISEGILTGPILAGGAILSATGVGIGLKTVDYDKLPQVGLLSAVFFVASLIHVPIGPSAAHLVLSGLCGILLGWAAFPAILVGLALQMLLFQFGGLTTLGVNTFNMAAPAVLLGLAFRPAIRSENKAVRVSAEFAIGAGSIILSGALVASCLMAAGEAFYSAAKIILMAHIAIMLIEGLLTIFIVEFIRKIKPEMIYGK